MTFADNLDTLKEEAVKAFNTQFNGSLLVDDIEAVVKKPYPGFILNVLFVTKDPTDHVRFQLSVKEFSKYSKFQPFILKNKLNRAAGSLDDEIQIATCTLSYQDYKHLMAYVQSSDYKEVSEASQEILTTTGKPLVLKSGFRLFSQR